MYAIIELAGKQYNVEKGTRLRCEKLEQQPNETMSIDKVLMVKDGENLKIGNPYVNGAEVTARIVGHARSKKIVVLKYKSKSNYRRKSGHRQHFTSVLIEDIKC
jgi:large subunit ribosomal protein L21